MAKTTGGALSLGVTGKIAGTMVFATWKGRPYVRQLVKPANPKTDAQIGVRSVMAFSGRNWKLLSAADQATFTAPASAAQVSGFNIYTKQNARLVGEGQGVASTYDPPATTVLNDGSSTAASVAGRSVTIEWTDDTSPDAYAYLVHVNGTTGFTNSRANLRGIVRQGLGKLVIENLKPATYYVHIVPSSNSGALGTAYLELSFTIT